MEQKAMKIVILERATVGMDVSVDILDTLGDVTVYDNSHPSQVAERIADADIVIANKMPLNRDTLKAAPKVKLLAQFATGYDNIDLDYCRERGIAVCNISDYSTPSVVQHTFALALCLSEHLQYYDEYVKSGSWASQEGFTHFGRTFYELAGKTWGVIGMGNIGRKVALAASTFGCRVIWASTSDTGRDEGYEQLPLTELLKQSDYVSLHCPLNAATHHLINADTLKLMKRSAILINVARGAVVDNASLTAALKEGTIAAAGLDVVEGEPISIDNPLNSIKDSDRLIITPHMAWASAEARSRVVREAYENITAFLNGEKRNRII